MNEYNVIRYVSMNIMNFIKSDLSGKFSKVHEIAERVDPHVSV